jgi:hypothetical protein
MQQVQNVKIAYFPFFSVCLSAMLNNQLRIAFKAEREQVDRREVEMKITEKPLHGCPVSPGTYYIYSIAYGKVAKPFNLTVGSILWTK